MTIEGTLYVTSNDSKLNAIKQKPGAGELSLA
jgi:hypothetical protein